MNNFERYLQLHRISADVFSAPPMDAWVIIPCYNEPCLIDTLTSLHACKRLNYSVGIIVVINAGELAPPEALLQNKKTELAVEAFIRSHSTNHFFVAQVHLNKVRKKHAGPGMARKYGMDLAVAHHYKHQRNRGLLLSLDADCTVASNYFDQTIHCFETQPHASAASIYFEHPLEGTGFPQEVYRAITCYEIYLRYYVLALQATGYPYSFFTLGSAFAVTAQTYVNQGGMNRKNAGEDFYFLQKIIPLGNYTTIKQTTVYPSPRISDRVVFGTGPAVKRIIENTELLTYPLALFNELKPFISLVETLYTSNADMKGLAQQLAKPLLVFLEKENFEHHLERIQKQSSSLTSFKMNFFQYFNGFMVVKFLNYSLAHQYYQASNVLQEVVHLYPDLENKTPLEVLLFLRSQ